MDPQEAPPKLTHKVPHWLKEWADAVHDYLKNHRPVPGLNVTVTAADGGGMLITTQPGGSEATLVDAYLNINGQIVQGQLYFVETQFDEEEEEE